MPLQPESRVSRLDRSFFVGMAIAAMATVFFGFAPNVLSRPSLTQRRIRRDYLYRRRCRPWYTSTRSCSAPGSCFFLPKPS